MLRITAKELPDVVLATAKTMAEAERFIQDQADATARHLEATGEPATDLWLHFRVLEADEVHAEVAIGI